MLKDLGIKVLGLLRQCLFWIDSLGFHFIDDAYGFMLQVMVGFKDAPLERIVDNITKNCYIIIGIFALFKCAVSLVNSIVNPEKLGDKEEGFGNILIRVVGAIVLFVVTPIIFEQSRFLQKRIVEENYIPQLILGVDIYEKCEGDECSDSANNPGELFQLVIMKAAIKPNENCSGTLCENAENAYKGNYVTPITVSKFMNEYEKNGEEYEFVYDYTPFILLVAGLFTTYVLISFTIDIAIRSVELLVLEVLSPLFIVTFIDPKMAKSGAFQKWLQACGKTYLSLFIKIAIVTLMLLFISELSLGKDGLFGEMNGFLKLFMLIAILIFAKKAPKWLGDMIGFDAGGGLGIRKKLSEAAGVGGLIDKGLGKASGALAGGALGAAAMLHANNKNRRALKKETRDELGYKRGIGKKARQARQSLYDANKDNEKYADMSKRKALKAIKKDAYADKNIGGFKNNVKQVGSSIGLGIRDGAKAGISAGNVKGSLSGSLKSVASTTQGLGFKEGKLHGITQKVRSLPSMENAWGTATERYDAIQAAAKNKKVAEWTNGKCSAGTGKGELVAGQGAANKFISNTKIGNDTINSYDDFLAGQFATANGFDTTKMSKIKDETGKVVSYSYQDNNGNAKTITCEQLQKDLGGLVNPASSYSVESQKMFNNYQTECLNNYNSNQQLASQVQSNYQGAVMQANACAANAKQMTDAITKGLTAALGGVSIKIDTNSMAGLKDGVEKNLDALNRKMQTADDSKKKELEKYINALTEIKEQCEQKEIFDEQIEDCKNAFNDIKESNEKLSVIVKEIEGKTPAEKQQTLVNNQRKLEDAQKAFEKKKEEK